MTRDDIFDTILAVIVLLLLTVGIYVLWPSSAHAQTPDATAVATAAPTPPAAKRPPTQPNPAQDALVVQALAWQSIANLASLFSLALVALISTYFFTTVIKLALMLTRLQDDTQFVVVTFTPVIIGFVATLVCGLTSRSWMIGFAVFAGSLSSMVVHDIIDGIRGGPRDPITRSPIRRV